MKRMLKFNTHQNPFFKNGTNLVPI